MSDSILSQYRVPGLFVPHLEAFVLQSGGDPNALYEAASLHRDSFIPQEHTLDEAQFHALVNAAQQWARTPAFGLEMGQQFNLVSFGLISRALMSCATLRDFVVMLERYSVLVLPMVRFSSHDTPAHFVLEVNALSRYPDLNQLIFEALISFASKIDVLLLGRKISVDKVTCQFERPAYAAMLEQQSRGAFLFNEPYNRIYVTRQYADLPLATANPTDARVTMAECEDALIKSKQQQSLVGEVLDLVRYYLDTNPSSAQIAQRLNMTDRTFRRRLAQEGASYRTLLQSVRCEMAQYYLGQTQLQVAQIAHKLGYAETSNFRTAFKGWTGMSPRAWRQANSPLDD